MGDLAVLGAPEPGLPASYRGTSRDIPLVQDELGIGHPANRFLLELMDRGLVPDGPIEDARVAASLADTYRKHGLGPFEVVEITSIGEEPRYGDVLLGYDVSFHPGNESILADILLRHEEPSDRSADAEVTRRMRQTYRPRLNANLLFSSPDDARAYLREVNEHGPWEGPGVEWAAVALWVRADPGMVVAGQT